MTVIPYDWPLVHPASFYFQDFGETYADEAAWRASFRNDFFPLSPPPTGAAMGYYFEAADHNGSWDTTNKFNCRATRRIINDYPAPPTPDLLGININDSEFGTITTSRSWTRHIIRVAAGSLPLLEPTPDPDDPATAVYLLDYASGGIQWEFVRDYDVAPIDGGPSYFNFYGVTKAWPSLLPEDEFFTITTLLEADPAFTDNGRARLWLNDALVIDTSIDAPDTFVSVQDTWYSNFDAYDGNTLTGSWNKALFEFVDGGTIDSPINPYSGLEGFDPIADGTVYPRCGSPAQFHPQVI